MRYTVRKDTRKIKTMVTALFVAALAKEIRCIIGETPRILRTPALIRRYEVFKTRVAFRNFLFTLVKKPLIDLKRFFLVFLSGLLADDFFMDAPLRGTFAMYCVRYVQLKTRTMITPRGTRWNSGLIVTVSTVDGS